MQTIIKINYPNIINFSSMLPSIGNMLMQKIVMKYEDIEEQKNIQPEATPCSMEILSRNITFRINSNFSIIGLTSYFSNDVKDEILRVLEDIFKNELGIENILSIGFQYQIALDSEQGTGLEYLKDFLIDSCETSPFYIFKEDKVRQAEVRLLVEYDSYRLNVILNNSISKPGLLEAYFQYLFANKGLTISKLREYKQIEELFGRDQVNFINNMDCKCSEEEKNQGEVETQGESND